MTDGVLEIKSIDLTTDKPKDDIVHKGIDYQRETSLESSHWSDDIEVKDEVRKWFT